MSRPYMAKTVIISPNPASRVWQGRFAPQLRSIRALRVKCRPPRASSAADPSRRRIPMPVYTVHAPVTNSGGIAATDKFAFVRDGFHFWAAVLGPLWLAWYRLWLALIGWIMVALALELALLRLDAGAP